MMSIKYINSTSTPFEFLHHEISEHEESGYHSNLSAVNSSVDSGYITSHSRVSTLSTFKTPETFVDSLISAESEEKSTFQLDEFPKYFRIFRPQPSLLGKQCIDFLYYFGEKSNHTILLKKIFEHLADEDLYNASAVSKCWKNVIMSIPFEKKRLRNFMKNIELTKENRNNDVNVNNEYVDCEDRSNLPNPRIKLIQIQNIRRMSTSSGSPASNNSSPSNKDFLFEAYQREGKKLKLRKRLFSCPKCKLPSHVDENIIQTAECTNSFCRYRFCVLCECAEHPQKMCNFISTPVVRKQSSMVGTKHSKKNLKRLLM